jgi:uncharacterized glyoxalase superfamily protein PhnB
MAKITRTMHVLAVHDATKSAEYYRDVLGFAIDQINAPGWRFVSRDSCRLMIGESPNEISAAKLGDHSLYAYIHVDDVNSLWSEFKANGAAFLAEVADRPWGMREFCIVTVDGHKLLFGQKISS